MRSIWIGGLQKGNGRDHPPHVSIRVKICGITRLEDALVAVEAGADALGFVFVPGTPRFVTAETAASILGALPPFVTTVGLFVDAAPEFIDTHLRISRVQMAQLHGDESPQAAASLRERVRVIKAFRVRGPETIALLDTFRDSADAYLLDAFVPGAHGGTGARFDWDLAIQARFAARPLVLAGGLKPENVAEAVTRVRPAAVDVSSGVESSPGRKDPAKIRDFIQAAKG